MAALPVHPALLLLVLLSSGAVWGCIPTVTPDDMYDQEYLEEEVRRSVLLTTARLAPPETSPATSAPTTTTTPTTSTTSTSSSTTTSTSTSTSSTTTTSGVPMSCPTNPTPWILNPLTGICYYASTSTANWQTAESMCGTLGVPGNAHLVSIQDQTENDFIFDTVMAGAADIYWIGLQQLENTNTYSTMGMWSDGSLYDYTGGGYSNWYGGTAPGMIAEDVCAVMYGHLGAGYDNTWGTGDCGGDASPYICEVPAT